MMKKVTILWVVLLIAVGLTNCAKEEPVEANAVEDQALLESRNHRNNNVIHQRADLFAFQPAGELGGANNVLTPGTFFPPTSFGRVKLKRTEDYLQVGILTSGLPQGAYTFWWVIFNDAGTCNYPNPLGGFCGEPDLLLPHTSIVWGNGKEVQANGVGVFHDRIYVGERRLPNDQEVLTGAALNAPLADPLTAEVHIIVKYHGLTADDPDVRWAQLNTILGSCGANDGANSYDAGPIGIQCFDPQFAIFPVP